MCVTDLDLELEIAEIAEIAEDEETPDPGPQPAGGQAPGAGNQAPGVAWGHAATK